jgi:hypothetical protein
MTVQQYGIRLETTFSPHLGHTVRMLLGIPTALLSRSRYSHYFSGGLEKDIHVFGQRYYRKCNGSRGIA